MLSTPGNRPRSPNLAVIAAALLAMAGAAAPVGAEPQGMADRVLSQPAEPRPRDCANADMIGLKLCAAADFRAADKALAPAYQTARARCRDEEARGLLLAAQRAWLRVRDATCEWEADLYRGGTMSGLTALTCLTRMTRERISHLEHAFDP